MKSILLLFTAIMLCPGNLLSQTLPPVFEIKNDSIENQELDSTFYQILEDKDEKWNINDIMHLPVTQKFHYKGTITEDRTSKNIHTYWHRYRLKNTMSHDVKVSLFAHYDFYQVYIISQAGAIKHYQTGFLQNWDKKDGVKIPMAEAIPIILKPSEEITVYDSVNLKHESDFDPGVAFTSTDKLIQEEYIDFANGRSLYRSDLELQEAFLLGILFLAIFFNSFFYYVIREKIYLYFALYLLFLGINRLYNIGGGYTYWFKPDLLRFIPYLGYAWAFIPFFLIQFFRAFLQIRSKSPVWDKILYGAAVLNVILGMTSFIVKLSGLNTKTLDVIAYSYEFCIINFLILVALLIFIRKVKGSDKSVLVGALPLLLVYIIFSPVEIFNFTIFFSIDDVQTYFRPVEMIFVCWLVLSFSWTLFRRFDKLQKENIQQALDKETLAKEKEIEKNELIAKQKIELEKQVAERTSDLKQSIEDLKSTQSQLIQSEKMASLGELTAGIAHEIQNPLNFVNNFSEVNKELLIEMKDEIEKGNLNEVKAIANDVIENQEKINHHGKRADAIVKGMLQHSRSSTGQKEPTDINALADEYLRLAYHGLRAKDKSFNATMKTDFDESIGKINIIPQDMGRVILNLITNAFYAVTEKKKQQPGNYEPTVTVTTKKNDNKILISVKDNGNGIPSKVLDKIFQPFFTTKPTGQGTGLGLSMSYDIVTKSHGGELKVETKEARPDEPVGRGEGSEFIIILHI